ncbi:MAG TPA: amino acid adenylation domain-containing protein, partial [Longimicrobiales bacterium]|nr:amino acid adenylation domain-containing protein [Longimicrobiales bacterium]
IGDPIEVEGLTRAFRRGTDDTGFCALGSIKSNFGHLDSAAGVAGFIKAVLSLHHRTLVPTLHFSTPSPKIDWESTPFYVNAETRPWDTDRLPRRAGVSAFGIGGTNAHVILEEAPPRSPTPERIGPHLLPISARTSEALDAARRNLAEHLREHDDLALGDVAGTLQAGRSEFRHRLALVASDPNDARTGLESGDPMRLIRGDAGPGVDGCVFLFPGGGAQYVGMGRGLLDRHPAFRDEIDRGIELLLEREGVDVRPIWFADEGDEGAAEAFQQPSVQLPALFILEMALARLLMRWGFEPTALIGHSLGENTAACLAGVLSYEDALGLVALRGRLFDTAKRGGMLSVAASPDDVRTRLGSELDLAAINAPEQCTVSGPREPLEALAGELELAGIDARMVPIDIAAHSAAVDPLLEPFRAYLESVRLHPPKIPFLSNRTGTWITDAEATDPGYWAGHLRDTVRFSDNVRTVLDEGRSFFFEAGPGRILSSLVQLGDPAVAPRVAATMRHPRADTDDADVLLDAVGRAWATGVDVDWSRIHDGEPFQRVALPGYPFERRPFIVHPEDAEAGHRSPSPTGPARSPEAGSRDPLTRALELQARTNAAVMALLGGGGDASESGETEAKTDPDTAPEPTEPVTAPEPKEPESEASDRRETPGVPEDVDLVSWLCENWGGWADRTAVIAEDGRLSYSELERRSNQLAHHLVALGLGSGDLVGICLDRSAEMVVATIASWKAGLGYVPLDPTHPSARLDLITERADLAALITDSAHATMVWSPIEHRVQLDRDRASIAARSTERPECDVDTGATAYVLFTSGSTGEPKGVRVPRRAVGHLLRTMANRPGLDDADIVLSTTTLTFDISVPEIFLPLRVGAKVVVATSEQARDGRALSDLIDRHGVTTLQFTPTGWRILENADWRGRCRRAISGGEALPRDLLRWLLQRADQVWNGYGPTETTVYATFAHLEDAEADIHIGHPLPSFGCYVLDAADQLCPTGVPGELCLAGPQVADGYVAREEETARSFVPDPFTTGRMYRTGDLVRWRKDGTLDHMGRLDQQVKLRGFRIELGEIESVLSSRPDVEAAVVALVDIDGTPELAGYVVPAGGSWDERSIREELTTYLPDYMIPRFLVRLEELPLTTSGKTDRAALPDPRRLMDSGPAAPTGLVEPTSEAESFLIELWQDILEVPNISVDDNFFDLGGHSLLAVRMIARVEREWGAEVPLRAVMAGSLGFVAREHLDTPSANAPDDEDSPQSSVSRLLESVRGWVSD